MNYNSLIAAVSILHAKGLRYCVVSPGSRSAPLTITFARHDGIEKIIVPDERSAAFIALGIALKQRTPVALVCTSGSAVLNYAPAIAEAFYMGVPLLILTADRPPEWIGQQDGQAIQQYGVLGGHVKASFTFPSLDDHEDAVWHGQRMINEAYDLSTCNFQGPVHINFPFREPFYPDEATSFDFSGKTKLIDKLTFNHSVGEDQLRHISEKFIKYSRVLLVLGQSIKDDALIEVIEAFSTQLHVPVCADITANVSGFDNLISHHDLFLTAVSEKHRPDLVITIGKSILSKRLKLFLRGIDGLNHWHIQDHDQATDVFQHLSKIICSDAKLVLRAMTRSTPKKDPKFLMCWRDSESTAKQKLSHFFNTNNGFSEFSAINIVNHHLPSGIDLHLANSMTVRYFNHLGIDTGDIAVHCNRGVSGIDGSTGTAVGAALSSGKMTVLVTGDLAFFYDRNSLWHHHLPANFRIIIMNNQGGGIFGLIPGPSRQPELNQYFETPHMLKAENTARDFNLGYVSVTSHAELKKQLETFFEVSDRPKILEIMTDLETNRVFYKSLMEVFGV